MRPNVEFRVELPKTNPHLEKSQIQQKTHGYVQKTALDTKEKKKKKKNKDTLKNCIFFPHKIYLVKFKKLSILCLFEEVNCFFYFLVA